MPSCAGACDCDCRACNCSSECTIKTIDLSEKERRRYEAVIQTLEDELHNLRDLNIDLMNKLLERGG